MAIKNENGEIVLSKQHNKKEVIKKEIRLQGRSFEYIGKTRDTGSRIVLYEGELLSEPDENGLVLVEYLDRNIKINPEKKLVKRELPIKFLKII